MSDWDVKKPDTAAAAIRGLAPGQKYNAFQGKTNQAAPTGIGPVRRFDTPIGSDLDTWLEGLKGGGFNWTWADVMGNMTPSLTGGAGKYDVKAPDGHEYQLQDTKYAGKRRTPDQIMPGDLVVVLRYRE